MIISNTDKIIYELAHMVYVNYEEHNNEIVNTTSDNDEENNDIDRDIFRNKLQEAYKKFTEDSQKVKDQNIEDKALLFLLLSYLNDISSLKIFFSLQNDEIIADIIEKYQYCVFASVIDNSNMLEDKQLEIIKYILELSKKYSVDIDPELVVGDNLLDGPSYIRALLQSGRLKIVKYLMEEYPTTVNWYKSIVNSFEAILKGQNVIPNELQIVTQEKICLSPKTRVEILEFLLEKIQDNLTDELLNIRPGIVEAQEYVNNYKQVLNSFKQDVKSFLLTCHASLSFELDPLPVEIWNNILLNLETVLLDMSCKKEVIMAIYEKINNILFDKPAKRVFDKPRDVTFVEQVSKKQEIEDISINK